MQLGFTKLISSTTRFSATRNSCIDQIITNVSNIGASEVDGLNISDHQLIYNFWLFSLYIYVQRKKPKIVFLKSNKRAYRNYDKELFWDVTQ